MLDSYGRYNYMTSLWGSKVGGWRSAMRSVPSTAGKYRELLQQWWTSPRSNQQREEPTITRPPSHPYGGFFKIGHPKNGWLITKKDSYLMIWDPVLTWEPPSAAHRNPRRRPGVSAGRWATAVVQWPRLLWVSNLLKSNDGIWVLCQNGYGSSS